MLDVVCPPTYHKMRFSYLTHELQPATCVQYIDDDFKNWDVAILLLATCNLLATYQLILDYVYVLSRVPNVEEIANDDIVMLC